MKQTHLFHICKSEMETIHSLRSCVTKFIKIQAVRTATKLSETIIIILTVFQSSFLLFVTFDIMLGDIFVSFDLKQRFCRLQVVSLLKVSVMKTLKTRRDGLEVSERIFFFKP